MSIGFADRAWAARSLDGWTRLVRVLGAMEEFAKLQGQYLAFIAAYTKLNCRPPAEADFQRMRSRASSLTERRWLSSTSTRIVGAHEDCERLLRRVNDLVAAVRNAGGVVALGHFAHASHAGAFCGYSRGRAGDEVLQRRATERARHDFVARTPHGRARPGRDQVRQQWRERGNG